MLDAFRLNVEMVSILDITDSTTSASVTVNGLSIGARLTDAVVLALKKGARLFATEQVLAEAGLIIPDESS